MKFLEKFLICGVFFLLLCNVGTGQFSLKFDYARLSDSIPLLNIVSSPVFTILIFYICVLYVYMSKRTQYSNSVILPLIILNYYFGMNEYATKANSIFAMTATNLTLQNGLLNVHPYIIYQLYGFVVIYLTIKISKVKTYHQYYFTSEFLKTVSLLILLGVLLGAWWAAQEFNWGGFWSWDPVELISLLLLLFAINLQHRSLENFSTSRLVYYTLLTIIIYLIMRLGLVSTIHSFIKSTSIPYYSYIIFIVSLSLCFLIFGYRIPSTQSTAVNPQTYVTSYFIFLIATLSLFMINLVLINFNLLSYYFLFSLSIVYFIVLVSYTINVFFFKVKFYKIHWIVAIILCWVSYYIMDLYAMFCFVFILFYVRRMSWMLHVTAFILYLTAVFFFNPIFQNYKSYSQYIVWYTLTDHYSNFSINGMFLSNFFLKKNIFMLTLKNYIHHGLGFTTYTKYTLSQFISFRNNSMSITYGEEFIFFIMLLYILVCVYNYKTLVRWDFKGY